MSPQPPPVPAGLGRWFAIAGSLVSVEPLAGGHIHDTFLATYGDNDRRERHVHQRVNARIFPDPAGMSEKVARVARHLGDAGLRGPRLASGPDGRPWALDDDGAVWRSYPFVEGARSFRRFPGPEPAAAAAAGLGRFLAALDTLPGPPPAEAIAGFHDFDRRRAAFEEAVSADPCGRATGCMSEIEAVRAEAGVAGELARARAAGRLPERVVHNDAKADNVLLDERTGQAAGVVDLDTVAMGTALFDFGDLVRSGAATEEEDGAPPRLRLPVAEGVVRGYLQGSGGLLGTGETELLGLAGPLMAYEVAMRYLTDHLDGDRYFRIERPGHNLSRCRDQLALLGVLVKARPAVEAMVARLAG